MSRYIHIYPKTGHAVNKASISALYKMMTLLSSVMLQFIYVDGKKLNFFIFNKMGKGDIIMIMSSLNMYTGAEAGFYTLTEFVREGVCRLPDVTISSSALEIKFHFCNDCFILELCIQFY